MQIEKCRAEDQNITSQGSIYINAISWENLHGFKATKKSIATMKWYMNAIFMVD